MACAPAEFEATLGGDAFTESHYLTLTFVPRIEPAHYPYQSVILQADRRHFHTTLLLRFSVTDRRPN